MKTKLILLIIIGLNISVFGQKKITGVAFLDKNANGGDFVQTSKNMNQNLKPEK